MEQIERARQVVPIAAVQNHYNLAERGHDDVVDYCDARGDRVRPVLPAARRRRRLDERHGHDSHAGLAAAALAGVLPIPGTLSIEHLRENLAALDA